MLWSEQNNAPINDYLYLRGHALVLLKCQVAIDLAHCNQGLVYLKLNTAYFAVLL